MLRICFDAKQDQWIEAQKLTASDGAPEDRFGDSVAIFGHSLIVGADGDDLDLATVGSAYVFDRRVPNGMWTEVVRFVPSNQEQTARFGQAVAVHDGIAVAGAPFKDDVGSNSGAVYVLPGLEDCNQNGAHDACDIADRLSSDINGDGIPDECDLPADVDNDGDVDTQDLRLLLALWGTCGPPCIADLDGSGIVDIVDLLTLLEEWT